MERWTEGRETSHHTHLKSSRMALAFFWINCVQITKIDAEYASSSITNKNLNGLIFSHHYKNIK